MTYEEITTYLFQRLPMFQRQGASAYKADLSNTWNMMQLLNHPESRFKSIHVAGTNGKGSVCHYLASIFQEAGYKTALYTSPHLIDYRERIRLNGIKIPKQEVIDFVERHKEQFEEIELSFFEWTVGLAFWYFAKEKVDVAIIETGMGGRLDSTNVVQPELSIVTNISFDHMQFLGNTLPKIALEKAGIIKENTPVLIGKKQNETSAVFEQKSEKQNAKLHFAEDLVEVENDFVSIKMADYQKENLRTVLSAVSLLNQRFSVNKEQIAKGIENVVQNTSLLGRWTNWPDDNRIILDVGHNPDGIDKIVQQLKKEEYQNLHIVWGMVSDKDINEVLAKLPLEANYYWCAASIPRALKADELFSRAKEFKLKGASFKTPRQALHEVRKQAIQDDLILVGGSVFVVGEIEILMSEKQK